MMNGARRFWRLLAVLVAMMVSQGMTAMAQIATTTVQDTVYSANGTPATGSVVVSWNAFTTAGGQSVAAGSTSATIGADGLLTMSLAPNAGSTPMGSYYTAVFHLGDGTTSRVLGGSGDCSGGRGGDAGGDQERGTAGERGDADRVKAIC
jgi:hypothetical protein